MKLLVIIACILLLATACATESPVGTPTNETKEAINDLFQPNASVEELNDDIQPDAVNPTAGLDQPLLNDTEAPSDEGTPIVDDTQAAQPVTTSGCPLISPERVMAECKRDTLPSVAIVNNSCVFTWEGGYTLSVSSRSAVESDFDQWLADYYTSMESGEIKPRAGRAEMHKVQYYAWFTGTRLIEAVSSNVLACNGDRIWHAVAAVDTKATLTDESGAMRDGIVADAKKLTTDASNLFSMLTMKYSMGAVLGGSGGSGTAKAAWVDGVYTLLIESKNLTDPAAGSHYEGWVIKKGTTWNVVDVGTAQKSEETYRIPYRSGTDLRDHAFVMLTLESDGKPVPGATMIEGRLQ